VVLRARSGPQREAWLQWLRQLWPGRDAPRRLPLHITDERLLGGLDLAASLQAGRPVAQRGLLAEADGGLLLLAMAERVASATAARLTQVMDRAEVVLERDGLVGREPARFGLLALDEGLDTDEHLPPALADRLAGRLLLDELPVAMLQPTVDGTSALAACGVGAADVLAARARLPHLGTQEAGIAALCEVAEVLGVPGLRAPWLAWRAACASAALNDHARPEADDLALAARLVLGPRATRLPAPPPADDPADVDPPATTEAPGAADGETEPCSPPPPSPPPASSPGVSPARAQVARDDHQDPAPPASPADGPLPELVLEAALAALPAQMLDRLVAGLVTARSPAPAGAGGRGGELLPGRLRGRPIASRRGELRGGARLDLIATLRAAAPWQALRRREAEAHGSNGPRSHMPCVHVRRGDFHIRRHAERRQTTTVFVVDASGSSALHRLAEAKGAVELLLAECYVRRDQVALIAFRGPGAELLLPPTRSLVRAKRALVGLPGGGGTPLAAALDAAGALVLSIRRRGGTPVLVLLTDGRANISRDGQPGRDQAHCEALAAAGQLRSQASQVLMVDTSPARQARSERGQALARDSSPARELAAALGALYLPLPQTDAASLARAVRAGVQGGR
jgi:magnesium chelatase subunit D